MRLNDMLTGLLILVIGAMVAGYAQTFPSMPGQSVGPSLFPTVIGIGFIFLGAALSASGLRRGERPA
nr:tripartite tricarboxylate transporter TctB family protein [Acidobacteriota bacterium]